MDYDFDDDYDSDSTNITGGTCAEIAYKRWQAKKQAIKELEWESELLMEKYFSEMRKACIPAELKAEFIEKMFADPKKKTYTKLFLAKVFTEGFLKSHKVEPIRYVLCGNDAHSIGIILRIEDYEYHIICPQPQNVPYPHTDLMGQHKYRVDYIHTSKANDFIKTMTLLVSPTYDWKECFVTIEKRVAQKGEDKKVEK